MSFAENRWKCRTDRLLSWAAIAGWAIFFGVLGCKAVTQPNERSTYPAFAGGAEAWLAKDNIYQPKHRVTGFRYGPAFAVSMIPLAVLPPWLGSLLWSWLNVAAMLAGAWVLSRWVLPGLETRRRQAVFFLLLLPAAVRTLWSAQSNALVIGLVAGAAAAVVNNRWWLAALLLAIPVHVKVWPLAAGLLMCACWPRRLIARYALCLLAVGALPLLAADAQYVIEQYRNWYAQLTGPALHRHAYRDAWTIWELLWPPVDGRLYTALQLSTAIGVLGLCLRKARQWRTAPLADADTPITNGCGNTLPAKAHTAYHLIAATFHAAADGQQHTSVQAAHPDAATRRRLLTFVLSMWAAWQLTFGPATERATFGLIAPLNAWAILTAAVQPCAPLLMVPASLLMTLTNSGELERRLPDYPVLMAIHPLAVLAFAVWVCVFWAATPARPSPSEPARCTGTSQSRRSTRIMLSSEQITSSIVETSAPSPPNITGGNGSYGHLPPTTLPASSRDTGLNIAHEPIGLRSGRATRSARGAG